MGTIVGALTLGLFVPTFVWVMNNSQKTGVDVGLMWLWAILLIAAFLFVMGMWHTWFAPKDEQHTPPSH
jgi:hypothetical protein